MQGLDIGGDGPSGVRRPVDAARRRVEAERFFGDVGGGDAVDRSIVHVPAANVLHEEPDRGTPARSVCGVARAEVELEKAAQDDAPEGLVGGEDEVHRVLPGRAGVVMAFRCEIAEYSVKLVLLGPGLDGVGAFGVDPEAVDRRCQLRKVVIEKAGVVALQEYLEGHIERHHLDHGHDVAGLFLARYPSSCEGSRPLRQSGPVAIAYVETSLALAEEFVVILLFRGREGVVDSESQFKAFVQ